MSTWILVAALSAAPAIAPGPSSSPQTAPRTVPTTPNPRTSSGEQTSRLVRSAGITGGISILAAYGVALGSVLGERCGARTTKPPPDPDHDALSEDYESSTFIDDGGLFQCYPWGFMVGSSAAVGGSVATVILSSLAGHRWAQRNNAQGKRLSPRRSTRFLLGGLGLRLAGVGLLVGIPWVAQVNRCPAVFDGRSSSQVSRYTRCVTGRTFGSVTMATVGLGTRWVGAGIMAYGAQHRRHTRRLRLSPYVAPSPQSTVAGVTGRF